MSLLNKSELQRAQKCLQDLTGFLVGLAISETPDEPFKSHYDIFGWFKTIDNPKQFRTILATHCPIEMVQKISRTRNVQDLLLICEAQKMSLRKVVGLVIKTLTDMIDSNVSLT